MSEAASPDVRSATSTTTENQHTPLTKLITEDLPVLKGTNPTTQDIAMWLIHLRRWARNNTNFGGYFDSTNRWSLPNGANEITARDARR